MNLDRRDFLRVAVGSTLVGGGPASASAARPAPGLKAIVFDAFPIFDPRPVTARLEEFFPSRGGAIMTVWRTRQFDYQWLRALSGHYADFLQTTEQALEYTDRQLKLSLSAEQRQRLMAECSNLVVWHDAPEALNALREAGLLLGFLSNMTEGALRDGLRHSRLEHLFEVVLSTDQIRSFKPDPRTYQLAADRLRLRRDEILFVPSAGWDVAGAKWFGYPTFWVNRLDAPAEALDAEADATGADLGSLVTFVRNRRI